MTKREFLDTVFALVPNEANKIMDAFDEYAESNEPHWIPVAERLPEKRRGGDMRFWFYKFSDSTELLLYKEGLSTAEILALETVHGKLIEHGIKGVAV